MTRCGGFWLLAFVACAPEPAHPDPSLPARLAGSRPVPPEQYDCVTRERPAEWGAAIEGDRLTVRVRSRAATRIEVELYDAPRFAPPRMTRVLEQDGDRFSVSLALDEVPIDATIYYGLRAWGPNWPHVEGFEPGTTAGFRSHVDALGNRFNPNKLLIDPYARELSQDPLDAEWDDPSAYLSGDEDLAIDSGPIAPKGIVLPERPIPCWNRPQGSFSDMIVYEVHLRGLTMNDPTVPEAYRGTYRGAAEKAEYLAGLGVTAIELLPLFETQNDHNDLDASARGDNYWGYSSLSFFAPDRRYAFDRSPGGPTRELQAMVRAFHRAGIEVWVDVVYNHTAEGEISADGTTGPVLSWRGLDNAAYYELGANARVYADHNGVSANINATDPLVRDLVIDSLTYQHRVLGIDGFRFDLAPLLGNGCKTACFRFEPDDPDGILMRATGLGVRLVAEPWGIGEGTYQLGRFPAGWAEWNGVTKDVIRKDQNVDTERIAPAELVRRLSGSPDLFGAGRGASASINYVACHDGFTLRDVYAYDSKANQQPWPYGPSPGGDDENWSWDHDGDAAAQRQAARTGLALVMLAAGIPMITGGDEMYRTQYGNNNPFNLDTDANWLDWSEAERHPEHLEFTRALIGLRRAQPDLSSSAPLVYTPEGVLADTEYLSNTTRHYLGLRRGPTFVAYNGAATPEPALLPDPGSGRVWRMVVDTSAAFEPIANHRAMAEAEPLIDRRYSMASRSLSLFIAGDP